MTTATVPRTEPAPAAKQTKRVRPARILLHAFLLFTAFMFLAPLLWTVYTSLRPYSYRTASTIAVPSSVIRVASQEGTWPRWSGRSAYPERFIAYDHTLPREKAHGAGAVLKRNAT